jgi:hypothetical protein
VISVDHLEDLSGVEHDRRVNDAALELFNENGKDMRLCDFGFDSEENSENLLLAEDRDGGRVESDSSCAAAILSQCNRHKEFRVKIALIDYLTVAHQN